MCITLVQIYALKSRTPRCNFLQLRARDIDPTKANPFEGAQTHRTSHIKFTRFQAQNSRVAQEAFCKAFLAQIKSSVNRSHRDQWQRATTSRSVGHRPHHPQHKDENSEPSYPCSELSHLPQTVDYFDTGPPSLP